MTAAAADRLDRLRSALPAAGVDAVLVGPGTDLQYLIGASRGSFERLTGLVVTPSDAVLIVPALERPGWAGTPPEAAGLRFLPWLDGQSPYAAMADVLPAGARVLAVDDHLAAVHALSARDALPGVQLILAGDLLADLRLRKTAGEVAALLSIGAAVDRVQLRMPEWLRAGRTELEVAADIAAGLVEEGHERADFVIVGSGPNGASPHHGASDRVIAPGDPVVVDIGGPGPDGYFSDCTRTFLVGGAAPDPDFFAVYELVHRAQRTAVAAVRPGVPAEAVDAAARHVLSEAGYGEYFLTRTGHGIGLEVHEHPYLVAGNRRPLEVGMAFSIEPGVYLAGRFGVRIEDIVLVGEDGAILANSAPTELVTVG